MRIKSTHPESQGPFVEIDDGQFDENKHEVYVESDEPVKEPEEAHVGTPNEPTDEPAAPVVTEPVGALPQPWAKK